MSIFFILSIASITRFDFFGSGSRISSLPLGPGPASPYRDVFRILELSKIET